MVRPARRSRSLRHVFRKAPGGRNLKHFVEKAPKAAHCSGCGNLLPGVARQRPIKMRNMSKSTKRPQRPFAGMLCTKCTRQELVRKARSIA